MIKIVKSVFLVLLSFMMILNFVSCGKDKQTDETYEESNSESITSQETFVEETTTDATEPTNSETSEPEGNHYSALQRTWMSADCQCTMSISQIDETGKLTGYLKMGDAATFSLDITPDYEGNYYQQLTVANETVDLWFYFRNETSIFVSLNGNGDFEQFLMF